MEKYNQYYKKDHCYIFYHEHGDCVYLESIVTEPEFRNKGIATATLIEFLKDVKNTGKPIYLLASSELGGDKDQLIKWYQKHGFTYVKDKDDMEYNYNMVRAAQ